jgi:hypothetical protein
VLDHDTAPVRAFWNKALAQEVSAVEDDAYTAGVYDDEPVATSSVLQMH